MRATDVDVLPGPGSGAPLAATAGEP
jgi:hypothetical protein